MHYITANSIISAQNEMEVYRENGYGSFHRIPGDIKVTKNAPELLEYELRMRRKNCMLNMGKEGDPYLPLEEKLGLTRKCLEVIDQYEYGLVLRTKFCRILRDTDLLASINEKAKCVVIVPISSCDEKLCRILEPGTSTVAERVELLKELQAHGIPAMIQISPILPFINDTKENFEAILQTAAATKCKGILCNQMGIAISEKERPYLYRLLDKYFPFMRIRYIKTYGRSTELKSLNAKELTKLFRSFCRQNNLLYKAGQCSSYLKKIPEKYQQMSILDFLS